MMHWLPLWPWLFQVNGFKTVAHCFFSKVQFAVYSVPFVMSMCPYVGARYWREVLIAMTLTHHCLLLEPSGLRLVPLSERYSCDRPM